MKSSNEETDMKARFLMCIIAITLLAAVAITAPLTAQDQKGQNGYTVNNLGTLGGTVSNANGINNKGWLADGANLTDDQTSHAVLWQKGTKIVDLGTQNG